MRKHTTLEKDNKDQSKYYLSYPKPPVLDNRWENRDINVVERANTPMFRKLDDIVIPPPLLELYFFDVLVDMIDGYTRLCNHREKANIAFEITNEKLRLFLSMALLSGCLKLCLVGYQNVKYIER